MKTVLFLLYLYSTLFANIMDNVTPSLSTSLTSEFEQSKSENNLSLQDDNTYLYNSFTQMQLAYDFNDDFYTLIGGKLNYQLYEKLYDNALNAANRESKEELNRADLSEASLNYDNDFIAFNVGRSLIDYNLLEGSMDGIIAMIGKEKNQSLRLFYIQNFQQFYYYYFLEDKNINDSKGLYGAIATLQRKEFKLEIFNYYMPSLKNLASGSFSYNHNNFAFHFTHNHLSTLSELINDEEFTLTTFEYLLHKNYFEIGASLTGANPLDSMYEFGYNNFTNFYFGNYTYKEDAKNIFAKYIYADNNYQFESLLGATNYAKKYNSYEIDLYLSYTFTKSFSCELGAIYSNAADLDLAETDKIAIITTMVYKYESF